MVNLNTITQNIQNSKHIPELKINVYKKFLQTEKIPVYNKQNKVNIPESKFIKNKIKELPEFYNNFVDHNNYYIYEVIKFISFYIIYN